MDLKEILHEIVNVAAGPGARKDLHDAIDAAKTVATDVAKDAPAVEQVVTDVAAGGF